MVTVRTYGAGAPVVLIHGIAGLFNSWRPIIPALARHYRVYELELPDYALAPQGRPGGFAARDLADHIETVLDDQGLSKACLVGNSFGGQLAAMVAARRPDLVGRLALVASSGLADETESHGSLLVHAPSRAAIARAAAAIFHDPERHLTEELLDEIAQYYSCRKRLRGFLRTARRNRKRCIARLLKRIQAPSLIVWGTGDRITPPALAHEFDRLLADSRLLLLDDCGHAPQIEQAGCVSAALAEFAA
jgi:pimeloyl-ACP methyl ester carboxylesterase